MAYNNNRFTPGNKGNLKQLINREYIKQFYNINNGFLTTIVDELGEDFLCNCVTDKANNIKQGWNDPSQTENMRISKILTGTLGGRTIFGNDNKPIYINELGGWHGQPNGSPKPLRNKF